MSEIMSTINEMIRKRTTSLTLGSYLFFWMIFHWQGIYVTLFVSQDLIYKTQNGALKNEYVAKYFFGFNGFSDWEFFLGIVGPALLTYIFVFWLPYVLVHFYKKEQWFKVERRIIKIQQEKRIQRDKRALAKEIEQTSNQEVEAAKAAKKVSEIDPEIRWRKDYSMLDSDEENYLKQVLECVYSRGGKVKIHSVAGGPDIYSLNPNALRFADSNGLVLLNDDGSRITLTEKGKFFARQYDGEI